MIARSARLTVLMTGGGTVGHLAPGFALEEALRARDVDVRFVTPGESHEADWFQGRQAPLHVPAVRLPRTTGQRVAFGPRLLRGVLRGRRLLRRERPGAVVALGGWPCVPLALAARSRRVPLALLAADAVPGKVVRALASRAGRLYVPHARDAGPLADHPGLVAYGQLIRPGIREARRDPARFGLDGDLPTLLVVGGSLGAEGLFRRWLDALDGLLEADPRRACAFQVLHVAGTTDLGASARYAARGVRHHVVPFLTDMGTAYATADLVLARAGANTCAELAAVGTPAVFVPYPHHADRQQFRNAEPLVAGGGATLVEEDALDASAVEREVLDLLADPERRQARAAAMRQGESDGAGRVAEDLIRFMEEGRTTRRRRVLSEDAGKIRTSSTTPIPDAGT